MTGSTSSARGAEAATAAQPLVMAVHAMPVATLDDRRRVRHGRIRMLVLLAVCAAPVVASYVTYYVIRPGARSNYGQLIDPPRPLPASLPLTGPSGEAVDAGGLRGQWLLVVVSGPDCNAGCERHLLLQRQLREALGRDKDRLDKVWFIAGDAPPRAAAVAAVRASPAASVLRVSRQALGRWLEPAAGHVLDDHLYLVDPLGNWMMRTPADPEPARLKRDIERLLRASASWDRAGR